MDNIKNKTALVTGGARGIGLAYVQKLLQNGVKAVAILDVCTSVGQTVQEELEKEFGKGKVIFFTCDVSNYEEFTETFRKIWKMFDGLDILINNAGMFNDRKWDQTLRVNVGGVIQGTLLAMDYMGKHKGGKGGTIVNVASVAALEPLSASPVYSGSKQNVLGFSRSLKVRYEQTGVRILVICPGVTETSLITELDGKFLDFVDAAEIKEPLNILLPSQPSEHVAEAVMNLIQKGQNGSVWVSEGSLPPYAVEFPPCTRVKLDL